MCRFWIQKSECPDCVMMDRFWDIHPRERIEHIPMCEPPPKHERPVKIKTRLCPICEQEEEDRLAEERNNRESSGTKKGKSRAR